MNKKNLYPESKKEANLVNETAVDFETKSKIFKQNNEEIIILPEYEKDFLKLGLEDSKIRSCNIK